MNGLSAVTPAVVDAARESPGDRGRIAVPWRCLRRLLLKILRQIILKMTGPPAGMLVDLTLAGRATRAEGGEITAK